MACKLTIGTSVDQSLQVSIQIMLSATEPDVESNSLCSGMRATVAIFSPEATLPSRVKGPALKRGPGDDEVDPDG